MSSTNSRPTAEDDLAQWTSRIRAIQAQVDAEDEAESRRLEDEIAASRLARVRRSRGVGYGSRISTDMTGSRETLPTFADNEPTTAPANRQQAREDTLSKLMGPTSDPMPTNSKPEPISLAAFMGGKATGPKLTKHAPQQDAHDPTQFEQRTRITSPHPVFGTGGVALPGLAKPGVQREPTWRDRRISTPTGASFVRQDPIKERSISPQKTHSRERTLSTPGPSKPTFDPRAMDKSFTASNYGVPRSKTPTRVEVSAPRSKSTTPAATFAARSSMSAATDSSQSRSKTPTQERTFKAPAIPPQSTSSQQSQPAVRIASLARPISSTPKLQYDAPLISTGPTSSPAFLKPPSQKDPTPSLSRLQGRGFVASMVNASKSSSSSAPVTPEKPVKKSSVLDRWPGESRSPPPKSPISPKPIAMRKSLTLDSTPSQTRSPTAPAFQAPPFVATKPQSPQPGKATSTTNPTSFTPTARSQSAPSQPVDRHPKLGSATTLILFKPEPEESKAPPSLSSFVDELGVQIKPALVKPATRSELPASPGKALHHPTKGRAKKPKKDKSVAKKPQSDTTVIRSSSPVDTTTPTPSAPSPVPTQTIQLRSNTLPPRVEVESSEPTGHANSGRVADRWLRRVSDTQEEASQPNATPPRGVNSLADQWSRQGLIGRTETPPNEERRDSESSKSTVMVGRKALPGMAELAQTRPPPPVESQQVPTPPSTGSSGSDRETRPPGVGKHNRIPSTGNRATVMEVAQSLQEQIVNPPTEHVSPPVEVVREPSPPPLEQSKPPISPKPSNLRAPSTDKRRSSYEKYSAIILPPLQEEATPAPTPAGTLSRTIAPSAFEKSQSLEVAALQEKLVESSSELTSDIVQIVRVDEPLPQVDIKALLRAHKESISDTASQTISVEVLSVDGGNSATVSGDLSVFYDTEVLAVIHRSKSKSSGLATTTVWGWYGKRSQSGEREHNKLQELARRYGTSPVRVEQYRESNDMLRVLGGRLAIRQGSRAHWSADNTSMHLVRRLHDMIFLEEIDLTIKNLCSGFSYCVTVLGSIYVWHGRGSVASERDAAVKYAESLGADVTELREGDNDNDEMFWMVFGEESFAQADYWKWRSKSTMLDPRIWEVQVSQDDSEHVKPVDLLLPGEHIYVVDCIWELYVVIGSLSRANRLAIRLSLLVAQEIAKQAASALPYTPNLHVVIMPSQIPSDLRIQLRGLDEAQMNLETVPGHMNVLSSVEAEHHLDMRSWKKSTLSDHDMLPLGVDPAAVV